MDDTTPLNDTSGMDSFTATGRPCSSLHKSSKTSSAMVSMAGAESWGAGPANTLPMKFSDSSLIPVPVLRPEDVGKVDGHKSKKSFFSSRRKSENSNFVIKQVPRGEYLEYYAKDEEGRYVGTEEPAVDCILKGEDVMRYRRGVGQWSNEVGGATGVDQKSDGVIR